MTYEQYKVDIPEGQSGEWGINHFEAKPNPVQEIRWAMKGRSYVPGLYTRLYHGHVTNVIMSDTPDEVQDHLEPMYQAHGRVLINGLGIGMVLKAVLLKPEVTSVDVVELEADVISLVAPSYDDPRVTIHHANAFDIQWPVGTTWDVAWHDIWPTMCTDHLPEMATLKRKYGKRVGWQACWGQEYMRRLRKYPYY